MILNQIQQQQQKIIDPSEALGYQVPKYLLSSMGFLNYMCKHTKYIKPIDIKSGRCLLSLFLLNQNKQLNINNINKDNWNNSQKLGIIFQIETLKTISIGKYNSKNQLNGLGISHSKNGSMIGIFKQDMLKTQFNYKEIFSKTHNIVTSQVKNIISHEHMKSLNYIHDLVYFTQILKIKQLFDKTLVYTKAFQKQYMKRYPDQFNSQNNRFLNQKYNFNLSNNNKYKVQNNPLKQQIVLQKKPGFILSKSRIKQIYEDNNKSPIKNISKKQNSIKKVNYKDRNKKEIQLQSSGSNIIYSQYQRHKKFQAETSKDKNSKFDFSLSKDDNEKKQFINTVRK